LILFICERGEISVVIINIREGVFVEIRWEFQVVRDGEIELLRREIEGEFFRRRRRRRKDEDFFNGLEVFFRRRRD